VKEQGAKVARKIVCEVALGLHEGNFSCQKIDCEGAGLYEGEKKTKEIGLHKR
jgi:hypothetical protein